MKKINLILIVFFIGIFGVEAQKKDSIIPYCKTETMLGSTIYKTPKPIKVSSDKGVSGTEFSFFLTNGILFFNVKSEEANIENCYNPGDKITLVFKGGSQVDVENELKANCDGEAQVIFDNKGVSGATLGMIAGINLTSIKIRMKGRIINKMLSSSQSEKLKSAAKCMQDNM